MRRRISVGRMVGGGVGEGVGGRAVILQVMECCPTRALVACSSFDVRMPSSGIAVAYH